MSLIESVGKLFGWLSSPARPLGPHYPSFDDVCEVRVILKEHGLPAELVLHILEFAEYIPREIFVTNSRESENAEAIFDRSSHAHVCMDLSIFDNKTANAIRKGGKKPRIKDIQFEIASHDQGWTSENTTGTYATSSWLEVSILRSLNENNTRLAEQPAWHTWLSDPSNFQSEISDRGWTLVKRPAEAEQGPQGGEGDYAWYLQGNRVASPAPEGGYKVIWTSEGYEGNEGAGTGLGFLRELRDGDRVLVWARAKWHGWKCVVDNIKVTVRYDTNR